MKITNQKVVFVGFITTLLFNIVVLSGFNILFVGSTYSFLYLCIIPGFFIQRLLRMRGIAFFELIAYIIGFSIAYLLIVGFSTNLLGFLPFMPRPLNLQNSLAVFNIYTIILLLLNYRREKNSLLYVVLPKVTFTQLFFYITPFFFPILVIIGAQLLNNSGVNILLMIVLFSIALYALLISICIKKLELFYFEVPIYLIAISLLFLFSLRSSYIIGWDVYTEYRVFLLTESQQLWSMANYPDAYNACLSITILPTLFHYFTKVDNAFVFKILFQCLFAFTPVTVYILATKFADRLTAFLSAFFFMSTLDFFRELPALVRQEIAYLFFGLLLLALFNKQLTSLQKKILFVVFGFSIVLSHYSTAYVLVALFAFACICLILYEKRAFKFFKVVEKYFTLKPLPVILFIAFAILWIGPITNSSGNIIGTFANVSANITNFGNQTLNTSLLDQLKAPKSEDVQVLLVKEIDDASKEYNQYNFTYYPKSTYKGYVPTIIDKDILPLRVSDQIGNIIYSADNVIVKMMKIVILLGFVGIAILFCKKGFSVEYTVLCIGLAIALLLITSVPAISLLYPIGRLYQQTLFLISLPSILVISYLMRFIPYRSKMLCITVLFIAYSLFTNTFISQLVGGQDPEVILNNSGLYYDEVYLHPSEIASIHWLDANNEELLPVFADIGSNEKMHGYSNNRYASAYINVFPSLISKNGYVYSDYANTRFGIGITNPKDTRMEYNFPNKFLESNKNLIYNNYDTKIYK